MSALLFGEIINYGFVDSSFVLLLPWFYYYRFSVPECVCILGRFSG